MDVDISRLTQSLRRWAMLGIQANELFRSHGSAAAQFQVEPGVGNALREGITPKIDGLRRMAAVAARSRRTLEQDLQERIDSSNRALSPLREPAVDNLGAHRWLRSGREEAYSDWLHWVLLQVPQPEGILRVLQLELDTSLVARCANTRLTAGREVWVGLPASGHDGRLDLLLGFGNELGVLIEVKTRPFDPEQGKNAAYIDWLQRHRRIGEYCDVVGVFIHPGDRVHVEGYESTPWADIAVGLRVEATHLVTAGAVGPAAMILAFVAAVEQNVLDLPSLDTSASGLGVDARDAYRLTRHIDAFLTRLEAG